MEQYKIDRINELARKSKREPLSEAELAEQRTLRKEYIAAMKASLTGILDNAVVQRPDGSREKLRKKN